MKAKIKSRIYSESHEILGEVAPLETPFVLLVDPSSLCNFRCRYCPTGNNDLIRKTGRYQGILDYNLFKKIIDDLKEFPDSIKVLRLYKEGEPLLNPHFSDMVKYAKDSRKVLKVDTTTNGALLNSELNRKIIKSGIDRINISVSGVSSEQIYKYSNVKLDFEKYVDNIRDLYENKGDCEIYIKSIKQNLTTDEQDKFYSIFGDMSDRIFLENLSPSWPEFEFNDMEMKFSSGHYGQQIAEKKVCPYIFYIMVINSDGKTSLCVGDWKHKLGYGDTSKQSVKDIWLGDVINSYRISHLENKRHEIDFCRNCLVLSHGTLENIDTYAEKIREKIKQKFNK
jgi:sulfatase maturation enzyme AslB (radical SAM superfamily)